jgi:hypothetical protein
MITCLLGPAKSVHGSHMLHRHTEDLTTSFLYDCRTCHSLQSRFCNYMIIVIPMGLLNICRRSVVTEANLWGSSWTMPKGCGDMWCLQARRALEFNQPCNAIDTPVSTNVYQHCHVYPFDFKLFAHRLMCDYFAQRLMSVGNIITRYRWWTMMPAIGGQWHLMEF